jgi:hypothetical protein
MRGRTAWAVGICGLCVATPSDQLLGADTAVVQPQVQSEPATPPDPSQGVVYICPMDPDVRSHAVGVCRRCGMTLVAGIPDPVEFHLDLRTIPGAPRVGEAAVLQFLVHDPWKHRPVGDFNVVHERFFHTFVVSEDLEFFEHGHPRLAVDGVFQYPMTFPKAGMFRVLGDYYPVGATPQLTSDTVFVPGGAPQSPVQLARDYSAKTSENLRVSFATIPEQPVATARTQLRFVVDGQHALERYLGAWGHMLAASNDLIDMMHEHPLLADGGPRVEFEIVFPRPGAYRLWVQFQSEGIVNTVHFDVPVSSVEAADSSSDGSTESTVSVLESARRQR